MCTPSTDTFCLEEVPRYQCLPYMCHGVSGLIGGNDKARLISDRLYILAHMVITLLAHQPGFLLKLHRSSLESRPRTLQPEDPDILPTLLVNNVLYHQSIIHDTYQIPSSFTACYLPSFFSSFSILHPRNMISAC